MPVSFSCPFLNLDQIAQSGQCFQWKLVAPNSYLIMSGTQIVCCVQNGQDFQLSCRQEDFSSYWHHYFDLDTDYSAMIHCVSPSDPTLFQAAKTGFGIRILHQEPWEVTVSFLISQNNNIPRITACLDRLRRTFGSPLAFTSGSAFSIKEELFQFPSPDQLAHATEQDFADLGMGIRAKYLFRLVQQMKNGNWEGFLSQLSSLKGQELQKTLCSLYGVGPKVADCIALFGLHRLDRFPVDTHISAVLSQYYPLGFPEERYLGFQGVMQQYLFYCHRLGLLESQQPA